MVWVSHKHADHMLGLSGILAARSASQPPLLVRMRNFTSMQHFGDAALVAKEQAWGLHVDCESCESCM